MDEKYHLEFLEKLKDKPLREIYIPPENRTINTHYAELRHRKKKKIYCIWINKKGKRIGEECGKIAFADKLCSSHYSLDIKNRRKNGEVVVEKNKQDYLTDNPWDEYEEDSLDEYQDESMFHTNLDKKCMWIDHTKNGDINCEKTTPEDRKWCKIHDTIYLLDKRRESRKNKEES